MEFIVLTNTKGGVGKSTLAAHLVIWLFDLGYKVALLDTDEQKTAARWVRAAEPSITVVTATDMDAIREARAKLQESHDFIIADTPGRESDAARTTTLFADLAIVPLQPSKPDIRAVKDALKNIRLAQEITGGKKPRAILVLNLTAKGDVQTRVLRAQLTASGFPVANCEVRRLNALRDACDTAVTRFRAAEGGEATRDVQNLFLELLGDVFADRARPYINRATVQRKAANE